jgi:hypothetical protein
MRFLLLLLITFPFFVKAQINRSANEMACEKVKEYIETKLFKDLTYKGVAYSQLKAYNDPRSHIAWSIEHKFEIETPVYTDKKSSVLKQYRFSFYLDKRLKVLKAESYMLE